MDNTFATEAESFPSQAESFRRTVACIDKHRAEWPSDNPKPIKFFIYCYLLGKEEVFFNLAEHYKTKC